MTRKLLTVAASAACLMALASCADSPDTESTDQAPDAQEQEGTGEAPEAGEMPQMPEPDVGEVPDVVATVNGTDLTGEDFITLYQVQFQQMAMQSQMSGQEPDQEQLRAQTLDAMIDSELLVQDARDRGYEATDDDVQNLLEETATANQMESVDELVEAYDAQGISEEQLRDDAQTQILVEELIDNDIEVAEPTEDEVVELYETMGLGEGEGEEGGYSLDEIRPELETQIRNQNRGEAINAHVAELRESAEVESYL